MTRFRNYMTEAVPMYFMKRKMLVYKVRLPVGNVIIVLGARLH